MPSSSNLFIDETSRLRLFWRISIFLVVCAIFQILIQIVAVAGILIYVAITDPTALQGAQAAEALQENLTDHMLHLMAAIAVPSVVCTLIEIWFFRKLLDRRPFRCIGFGIPEHGWAITVFVGIGAGAVPMLAITGLLYALGQLTYVGWTIPGLSLAILIPGLLFAAFFEELVFRGYMLRNIVEANAPWAGIWVNSVLFWLLHSLNPSAWQSPWVGINLVLAGVLLSLAYLASNNIWFPTIMHFGWNFAQGPLLGIPVSGVQIGGMCDFEATGNARQWLSGGEFGYEASALCTITQLGMCALFYWIWQRRCEEQWREATQKQSVIKEG